MNLPKIQIQQTQAEIGIRQSRPQMTMRQPKAIIDINQPLPEIEIVNEFGKLSIDQSAAFAQADVKHIFERIQEWAQKGEQAALQATAKAAQEGTKLMRIENEGNPIVSIAAEDSVLYPTRGFQIGYVPKSTTDVKHHFERGEFQVKVQSYTPNISIKPQYPIIEIPKWQTDVYLKAKSSISFNVVGGKVDYQY
ncbi:DUF6470 family protein [Bacillus solimangrovi]|uniref:Uncharacterized protein n=1 Tax=Bacillus solimangrovi TaxID=1305675 RepID=A0A1E5LDN6_9BACI|nr:DUF6470 family protein [Bacillus solimangrovi]OEH92201.1 hypothetical protein BFG57_02715 [Bacillus solimangrovi]